MRISDWSSDVCSSDVFAPRSRWRASQRKPHRQRRTRDLAAAVLGASDPRRRRPAAPRRLHPLQSGETWTRRSEEHTSELQSLMRISYAVFCLKKKKWKLIHQHFNIILHIYYN